MALCGVAVACCIYDREVVGLTPRRVTYLQVVATWMGECLRTDKPSRYITNTKINSAFYPSGVGKSSTDLYGFG